MFFDKLQKEKMEQKYTFEEYLELEEKAEYRSEFWNGEIKLKKDEVPTHSKISARIGTVISNDLNRENKDCSIYSSSLKVFIPYFNSVSYPDGMVICNDEELHEKSNAVVTNPCLIIEVLSESTKEYDSNAKFEGYRSIPSFKEYVLVWQTIPKVQSWYKEDEDLWRISSVFGLDKTIQLYSIDCEIALKDIYKRVKELGTEDNPKAF